MTFQGPYEARDALLDFIIDRTAPLPDDMRAKLRELLLQPSPVAGTAEAVELLYARRADVPAEFVPIVADAASFCAEIGAHGLADDGRGTLIALVMRRDSGTLPEDAPFVAEGEEPVPAKRYVAEPVEEAAADNADG